MVARLLPKKIVNQWIVVVVQMCMENIAAAAKVPGDAILAVKLCGSRSIHGRLLPRSCAFIRDSKLGKNTIVEHYKNMKHCRGNICNDGEDREPGTVV